MIYISTFYFVGEDLKEVSRKYRQDIVEVVQGDGYPTALTNHNVLLGALRGVSAAAINKSTISAELVDDTPESPASDSKVYEKATLIIRLVDPTNPDKTTDIDFPAPDPAVWVGTTGKDKNRINVNAASVVSLMLALSPYQFSDGELIDDSAGTNGLEEGYRTLSSLNIPH